MIKLYYRIGLMRDKDILKNNLDKFNGIIIDAHVFETFKNSLSAFIASLPPSHTFLIDPVTYRFSIPEITLHYSKKPWFAKLLERYNLPISEEDPYLNPLSLSDSDIKDITDGVIKYQKKIVPANIQNALGLAAFFEHPIGTPSTTPEYIIPPYLIIDDSELAPYSEYLKFNIKAIKHANSLLKNSPHKILSIIPISKPLLLDEVVISKIIDEYTKVKTDAFGIWISGLNEITEARLLTILVAILHKLKESTKKPIINLYGGFFSLILSSLNLLDGVAHGIGYAESRNAYELPGPLGPRYYNPITHNFETIEGILTIYMNDPSVKCKCPYCKKYDLKNFENIANNLNDLLNHFIYTRTAEKEKLEKISSINDIISLLENDKNKIINILTKRKTPPLFTALLKKIYEPKYAHLESWILILKNLPPATKKIIH